MSEELTTKKINNQEEKNRRSFIKTFAGLFAGLTLFGGGKNLAKSSPALNSAMSPLAGADSFIGSLGLFAGNYAPVNWLFCHGQVLSIAQYQSLFALIGTTYGGNGTTTFGLPDLRGRTPIGAGTGTGLTSRPLGSAGGVEAVQLTEAQLAPHSHTVKCDTAATTAAATGNVPGTSRNSQYGSALAANMNAGMILPTGSGQAHYNMQPYQAINYIICYNGLWPQRP